MGIVKALSSSLNFEPFANPFLALGIVHNAHALISVGLRRRGGNISADLSLVFLLYINTNFMNKLKINYVFN